MAEALAGIVCGYGLALIATPAAAIAMVRARNSSPLIERLMPQGSSLLAVSMILHFFAFVTFTAIGMLLGLLLAGIEDSNPAGGLGSPNGIFTGFIIATTVIAVAPITIYAAQQRMPMIAAGLLFAGVFGWMMPYLSLWGPGQS